MKAETQDTKQRKQTEGRDWATLKVVVSRKKTPVVRSVSLAAAAFAPPKDLDVSSTALGLSTRTRSGLCQSAADATLNSQGPSRYANTPGVQRRRTTSSLGSTGQRVSTWPSRSNADATFGSGSGHPSPFHLISTSNT